MRAAWRPASFFRRLPNRALRALPTMSWPMAWAMVRNSPKGPVAKMRPTPMIQLRPSQESSFRGGRGPGEPGPGPGELV